LDIHNESTLNGNQACDKRAILGIVFCAVLDTVKRYLHEFWEGQHNFSSYTENVSKYMTTQYK